MKIQEIRELIKLVDQSSIDEIEIENDGSIIKMKKQSGVTLVETPLVANVPTQQVAQVPVSQPAVAEVKKKLNKFNHKRLLTKIYIKLFRQWLVHSINHLHQIVMYM